MDSLPKVLGELLGSKGMSQKEFARRVGLTAPSINQVVRGHHSPRPDRSAAWCAALGLNHAEAKRLTTAIHLAAASSLVRAIVRNLERDVARLKRQRG